MSKWRVGVVLLFPEITATEIDVLRRALGAAAEDVDRIPPHLTLVPPLNVAGDAFPAALARLREAADQVPFEVALGPVTSFDPITPTIHLAVRDSSGQVAALRDRLFQAPLWRHLDHPFTPHVTLRETAPLHQVRAACTALRAYRLSTIVGAVTLLAEEHRHWRPLADVRLGGVRVVGRGGLPVELATSSLADPEALQFLRGHRSAGKGEETRSPTGAHTVITARCEGEVVGVGWGPGDDEVVCGPQVDEDLLRAEWRRRSSDTAT